MFATILHEAHRYVGDYGYVAVGLGILLEDFGLPVPGETLLITGSVLASRGALDIRLLLVFAWFGAVIGDNIGFIIGHTGGHKLLLRYGHRIGITTARLNKVEHYVQHYGAPVIIFARFFVVLRQFNGIVAGSLRMHWAYFLICNSIGAALWVGFWGSLTYFLGRQVFDYLKEVETVEPLLIGGGVVAALAIGGYYLWRRRKHRKQREPSHAHHHNNHDGHNHTHKR